MYLEKLEIQGFKSFAKKTILEFPPREKKEKSITAIVGPNGSGKSNVADAVRWVLGEQSLKLLRGKKSEDVIFFGSRKKSRLGFAEVSLYLNNEDGRVNVDYSEVVLTRRLYRSGESEYLINKSKVRLSDIVLFLAQANFGQKNYSIIGQGMVDRMLLATPHERKKFFDEATGVEQYQIKRDSSILKLRSSQENLKQATLLMEEIEPRVKFLGRQMRKLEQRSEIEKKLKELQRKYYASLWHELNSKLEKSNTEVDPLQKEKEKIEEAIKLDEEKLKKLEKEKPRTNSFKDFQNEYRELYEKKNRLREKELNLKNKLFLAQSAPKVADSTVSIKDTQEWIGGFYKKYKNVLETISRCKKLEELDGLKDKFVNLKQEIKKFLSKFEKPERKKSAPKVDPVIKKELNNVLKEIEGVDVALSAIQANIDKFNKEQETERKSFFDLQRSLQKKQHELYSLTSRINRIQVEDAGLKTRKDDLEIEIKNELENFFPEKEKVEEFDPNWHNQIIRFKRQMELIGGIDPEVEDEYKETSVRYEFLKKEIEDLSTGVVSLFKVIKELDSVIKKQFNSSFKKINSEFEKYFKILFDGGRAQLTLKNQEEEAQEDEQEDILEEQKKRDKANLMGIEIEATPPGKKLKSINMLSGGERALTSIALISAIISNNPSPFVVLDEVDAALDESNSIRFANIFDELSKKTQFILITHNRATMQKANTLYGVTMETDGISRILGLKLDDAVKTVN